MFQLDVKSDLAGFKRKKTAKISPFFLLKAQQLAAKALVSITAIILLQAPFVWHGQHGDHALTKHRLMAIRTA